MSEIPPVKKRHILVIGGGVIGLQCALTVLSTNPNHYDITLIAEFLPGNEDGRYASAWAGAQWRSHEESLTKAGNWDLETYRYWLALVKTHTSEETGVAVVRGVNYWQQALETPDPWWADYVEGYQLINPKDLPPDTAFGISFNTFTIDVQVYLRYLRKQIENLGGNLVPARLSTKCGLTGAIEEASKIIGLSSDQHFDAVINASGMQAQELVNDDSLYPVRGQTVKVRGSATQCTTRLGKDKNDRTVIITRPDAGITIIGVTSEPGVSSTEVDPGQTEALLYAAKPFCPELLDSDGNFDVIEAGVGIRPARRDGPRVELEHLEHQTVIHAYGVAGGGYQNSIGLAREVLRLLQGLT